MYFWKNYNLKKYWKMVQFLYYGGIYFSYYLYDNAKKNFEIFYNYYPCCIFACYSFDFCDVFGWKMTNNWRSFMSGLTFMSADFCRGNSCCRYLKGFANYDEGRSSETIGTIAWREKEIVSAHIVVIPAISFAAGILVAH